MACINIKTLYTEICYMYSSILTCPLLMSTKVGLTTSMSIKLLIISTVAFKLDTLPRSTDRARRMLITMSTSSSPNEVSASNNASAMSLYQQALHKWLLHSCFWSPPPPSHSTQALIIMSAKAILRHALQVIISIFECHLLTPINKVKSYVVYM